MAAAGKVCTGFSLPWVAKYSESGGVITYSNAMRLARGVDVSLEPDSSDDNVFYADNQKAESDGGIFTGGTLGLTVDGLFIEAERMIMGLPAAVDGWVDYDDNQKVPYMGVGYVARYQSDGVETFVPTIVVKAQFGQIQSSHATSEDTKNYQTQSLSASVFRGDDDTHKWKRVGDDYDTEAEAEAAIKEVFNVSGTTGST